MASDEPKLTDKQAMFVREYLIDLNATQAAKRAGYAQHTAQEIGSENLSKPMIAAAIIKAQAERVKRLEIEADWVLQTIARRAKTGMSRFVRIDEWGHARTDLSAATPDELDCITEVSTEEVNIGAGDNSIPLRKIKIKIGSQDKNLEMLMRHMGLFDDKQTVKFDLSNLTDDEVQQLRDLRLKLHGATAAS